jgi:hypothetical protein
MLGVVLGPENNLLMEVKHQQHLTNVEMIWFLIDQNPGHYHCRRCSLSYRCSLFHIIWQHESQAAELPSS